MNYKSCRKVNGFIIALLVFLTLPLKGQTIVQGSDTIGMVLIDSTFVVSPYLDFGRPVYSMETSPQQDYLLMMFRDVSKDGKRWKKSGEIGLLRLGDRKLLWTQPFNYNTTSFLLTRRGVITIANRKVTMLSKESGNALWQRQFSPVQVDDSTGVIVGYGSITGNRLYAYSIETGEELWSQKVPRDKNWGWNDVVRTDSLHWLVACDNLSRLNVATGEMEEYEAKTGVVDVKGVLLQALAASAGAFAGAAVGGGYYYTPIYGSNIINGLHSNIWQADSSIFFADRRKVARLDSHLQPQWETELPPKTATRSLLVSDDSLLYMFSFGMGYSGLATKKMGRPFIAAFNMKTGQQQFINMLSMKKDMVSDALITPRCTYMMFDDGLAYKSDLCDSTVSVVPWDEERYGKLSKIMQDTIYIYYPLRQTFMPYAFDGQNCPVMTDRGDIYIVNERLDIWQRFTNDQLYSTLHSMGDRRLVYHRYPTPKLVLIQELGMPEVSYYAAFSHLSIMGRQLYMLVGQRLFFIDLPQ